MLKAIVTGATGALAALALSGCISFTNGYGDIRAGMSPAEVRKAMGSCPTTSSTVLPYRSMTFNGKWLDVFQLQAADYSFVFKNNALIEFGEGQVAIAVRDGEPGLKFVPAGGQQQAQAKPPETRVCAAG
jgi:hypothetical protein